MMLALWLAVMAAVWLIDAADSGGHTYQLHGAVVFTRTGEKTLVLEKAASPRLTALGAQQLYQLGEAFRGRYIDAQSDHSGLGQQPLLNLASNRLDSAQLEIRTLDTPYLVASAQAFMQGLYPPSSNSSSALPADGTVLANGTVVDFPLQGFQYADVEVAGAVDPNSVYLAGSQDCPSAVTVSLLYPLSRDFQVRPHTLSLTHRSSTA